MKVWFKGNSMLIELPSLKNAKDRTEITSGVTVEAEVFEAGTTTDIQDDQGASINPISMTHSSGGDWHGTAPDDAAVAVGDELDIKVTADGGDLLTGTWWFRGVPVEERSA